MSVKQVLSEALGGVQGTNQPRGLHNFIQEIRLCSNTTQEQQRVDKELANIRNKFSSSSGLSSYNRKKYVWKLVYMFMLGYEIDFGHMEMISLIGSTRYSEKNVGYIAVSLLLRSGDTMMSLVINSIRNDLNSHSSPAQTLALATVANLGGSDLCEALLPDVERLLVTRGTEPAVRKKAALCFLRFFRENPGSIVHSEYSDKMASLLENKNLGVVTSVMSLLMGLASRSPGNYEGLVPHVIHLLTRLVLHKACAVEYLYYGTPSPWLHVKLLKFLQLYPPPADGSQREKLDEALERIISKTEISLSVNKSNADHCILFEAVNVIIHHGQDSNEDLRSKAMALLGRFIAVKEPNIRYLGLEVMSRLARLEGNETAKRHQATVLMSLKDADISIRRRALDLLFVMADESNATDIVQELVTYLAASDAAIREEMVLKIAILAEKFTDDLNWYVDKMLEMIALAGDFVAGAVWHRIIQIVTNHKDLQAYAAERLFVTLKSKRAHQTAVNIGGYILGEFGYFIAEQVGMSGEDQFHVLHQHFPAVGPAAKALLLSTYAKLANLYPECRDLVTPVFERFSSSQSLELQQRSCEYLGLPRMGIDVMEEVLKEMPAFLEDRESGPEARLRRRLEEQELGAEEGLRTASGVGDELYPEEESTGDGGGVSTSRGFSRGRREKGAGGGEDGTGGVEGGGGELVVREEQVAVDDLLGIGGSEEEQQIANIHQNQYPLQPQPQVGQNPTAYGVGVAGGGFGAVGGSGTIVPVNAAAATPGSGLDTYNIYQNQNQNQNAIQVPGTGALVTVGGDGQSPFGNNSYGSSNNRGASGDLLYGNSASSPPAPLPLTNTASSTAPAPTESLAPFGGGGSNDGGGGYGNRTPGVSNPGNAEGNVISGGAGMDGGGGTHEEYGRGGGGGLWGSLP